MSLFKRGNTKADAPADAPAADVASAVADLPTDATLEAGHVPQGNGTPGTGLVEQADDRDQTQPAPPAPMDEPTTQGVDDRHEEHSAPAPAVPDDTKDDAVLAAPSRTRDASARVYGQPALLQPCPRQPGEPVGARAQQPPDTALDWFSTPHLDVRAVSARGHMHRYEAEPRQDAFALALHSGFCWVAVADGVGSSRLSHIGAALATAEAVDSPALAEQASRLAGNGDQGSAGAGAQASFADVAQALRRTSDALAARPSELACTLVVAAVSEKPRQTDAGPVLDVITWHIGDSELALLTAEGVEPVGTSPEHGALINTATASLPADSTATVATTTLSPGETLIAVTDGVSNVMQVIEELRDDVLAMWRESAPTPAQLLATIDATVRSFDDDRTFVGVRFRA